jgi:hypothetical protein
MVAGAGYSLNSKRFSLQTRAHEDIFRTIVLETLEKDNYSCIRGKSINHFPLSLTCHLRFWPSVGCSRSVPAYQPLCATAESEVQDLKQLATPLTPAHA